MDKSEELYSLVSELAEYSNLSTSIVSGKAIGYEELNRATQLHTIISRRVGYLGALVSELSGIATIDVDGKEWDMWRIALKSPFDRLADSAIGVCVQATNRAIGKLLDDIRNVKRDPQTGEIISTKSKIDAKMIEVPPEDVLIPVPPKAFIVHGGKSGVLEKLREFIEALGIKPLIVEMLPSKGMTIADKVKKYQQEADCAIILATRGGIIDTKSGKQHPRLNVIDELSSFWEAFPERVIVLLEKGAELPSNKSGLTYEPFARQSMDRAFMAIARELTEMKILKAVKP